MGSCGSEFTSESVGWWSTSAGRYEHHADTSKDSRGEKFWYHCHWSNNHSPSTKDPRFVSIFNGFKMFAFTLPPRFILSFLISGCAHALSWRSVFESHVKDYLRIRDLFRVLPSIQSLLCRMSLTLWVHATALLFCIVPSFSKVWQNNAQNLKLRRRV